MFLKVNLINGIGNFFKTNFVAIPVNFSSLVYRVTDPQALRLQMDYNSNKNIL